MCEPVVAQEGGIVGGIARGGPGGGLSSGLAMQAFPRGWLAHPEDQIEEENE